MKTLVIGELNIDLIVSGLESLPILGKEILCSDISRVLGSSSAIFAAKLAGLGADVSFLGVVGDDENGQFVLQELERYGVDTSLVMTSDEFATGIGISLSYPEDRAILTYLGSIDKLTLADIDLSLFSRYQHLHVASYFLQKGLQSGLKEVFLAAKEEGLTISFDPGWDPEASWSEDFFDLLKLVDIFLPNEVEALSITQKETPGTALTALSEHPNTVVIKQGEKGALGKSSRGICVKTPAFSVDPIDTTGAGDSFDAGFVYAYRVKAQPFEEALRFACACGAMGVKKIGGASSPPSEAEVLTFLAESGV